MRKPCALLLSALLVMLLAVLASPAGEKEKAKKSSTAETDAPRFLAGDKLVRPEDYREWIYVSSGLGMSYAAGEMPTDPDFTNVFVKPESYRAFLATGAWPDKTIFVLEERGSSTNGSINKAGHFQVGIKGMAAAVKDEARYPEKWAYFGFSGENGKLAETATAFPKGACWKCHNEHGMTDNTFVQFYPTLKPVAEARGIPKKEPAH